MGAGPGHIEPSHIVRGGASGAGSQPISELPEGKEQRDVPGRGNRHVLAQAVLSLENPLAEC